MLSAALGAIKLVSRLALRIVLFFFSYFLLQFQARIRVPRTYSTAAVANSHDVLSTNAAIPPFLGPCESSVQSNLSLANYTFASRTYRLS